MLEKEMIDDLVLESREHLQSVEPDLLTLEQNSENISDELINRIFRAVHSIKGGFGFFGIAQVTKLSHAMENVLSRIRDHAIPVDPKLTDALLQGIDKLRVLLDDISHADSISIDHELSILQPFRGDVSSDAGTEETTSIEEFYNSYPNIDKSQVDKLIKEGLFIYRITLTDQDCNNLDFKESPLYENWQKIGKIIDINSKTYGQEKRVIYTVIFMTVLEPDIIAQACEIPGKNICKLTITQSDTVVKPTEEQKSFSKTEVAANTESKPADDTLRVRVGLLNNLMNLAGELVLNRNQLLLQFNHKLSDILKTDQSYSDLIKSLDSLKTIMTEITRTTSTDLIKSCSDEFDYLQTKVNEILSISMKDLPGISSTLQSMDSVTSQLQENIMQTRLQPISVVFNKFPRVVRDLAHKLGKDIKLELIGQNVELDKSIVELLSDPLNHLVRNSADHGIESVEDRIAAGKPATGTILLHAFQEGGKVIVEISDDGRGIDAEKVRQLAISKGLITEKAATEMTLHELQMLIIMPGFSTANQISDISGRGVGMDVVKSNIEKLGGTVSVESQFGSGTTISLTLPLTLAIIPTLIVSSEGRTFAIPQVGVEELVRIRSFELTQKIERIQGAEVMRLRGKLLPLVRLSTVLELVPTFIHPVSGQRLPDRRARWSDRRGKPSDTESENKDERRTGAQDRRSNTSNAVKIVVLKTEKHLYGLVIDSVYESEEIVVKPLPDYLKTTQCYAGATIMGDGKVALILYPNGIANKAGLRFSEIDQKTISETDAVQNTATKPRDILIFNNGTAERFGLDLSHVARIELANANQIEKIGIREFLNRNNTTLPVIRLHEFLPVNTPENSPEEFFVIIPRDNHHNLGIIATQVQDTTVLTGPLEEKQIKGAGIMGSAILDNHLTILLDVPSLLQTAANRFEA